MSIFYQGWLTLIVHTDQNADMWLVSAEFVTPTVASYRSAQNRPV